MDFEKISDTFEDGFENATKFVKKNKVFALALLGVGVFALYKAYISKNTTSSEATEYAYVPSYYDGYPTLDYELSYGSGGMSDYYDYEYESSESIKEQVKNESADDVSNIVNSFNSSVLSLTETLSYLDEQRKIEKVKTQMQNNSNLWNSASEEEKIKLQESNQMLGASIGATFDSKTGTWWMNGERLFYTNNELSGVSTPITSLDNSVKKNENPSSTSDVVNVTYDNNTDYMGKIIDVLNNGGSVADVNMYDAQRDAKISGEGITTVYYDKNTNYQELIDKAVSMGADQSVIDSLNEMRNAKIDGEKMNETKNTSKKSSGSSSSKSSGSTVTVKQGGTSASLTSGASALKVVTSSNFVTR